uniref:Ubiquitin-like protease family profile domain-containing protein n=1 Tax=Glossina brevipalpis TaxID=37001 RepID=A0A1A9W530_9MUSC
MKRKRSCKESPRDMSSPHDPKKRKLAENPLQTVNRRSKETKKDVNSKLLQLINLLASGIKIFYELIAFPFHDDDDDDDDDADSDDSDAIPSCSNAAQPADESKYSRKSFVNLKLSITFVEPVTSSASSRVPRAMSTRKSAIASKEINNKRNHTLARQCSSSPLFDDNWVKKTHLWRENRNYEIKNIVEIVKQLIDERRVAETKIQEHLQRLEALDSELLTIDDFEKEFPQLTKQHLLLINVAISGVKNRVLVTKFNINITRGDIQTLCDSNWLNDKIIDFYMNLLVDRSEKKQYSDDLPTVYAMSTAFLLRLRLSGYDSVKRWTRKEDIFSKDILLIPINVAGTHWCIAIVQIKNHTIKCYDSMGLSNPSILKDLKQYLKKEAIDKCKEPIHFTLESVSNTPRQINDSDCGVISCIIAEYVTRNKSITFSGQHMKYFRKKMILEIIQGELLQ